MMVRQRCVRPARHDRRERHRLGSELADRSLHPPGERGLGPTAHPLATQELERLIQQARRAAHGLELGGILHGPQALDALLRGHERRASPGKLCVLGNAEVFRLERDRALDELGQTLREIAEQVALGVDDVDPVYRARGLDVTPVGEQASRVVEQNHGVRAREAGQVENVRRLRDENGRGPQIGERRAQSAEPIVHEACRVSQESASL